MALVPPSIAASNLLLMLEKDLCGNKARLGTSRTDSNMQTEFPTSCLNSSRFLAPTLGHKLPLCPKP